MSGGGDYFPAGSFVELAGEAGWWEIVRWERDGEHFHARRESGRGHVLVAEFDNITSRRGVAQ